MKKVLVFGTFDIFHPGHEYLLNKAACFGELYVLVARDETVLKVKHKLPKNNQESRLMKIQSQPSVKQAFLGDASDYFAFLKIVTPEIICLGYDQRFMIEELKREIKKRNLNIKLVTLDSFHPDKYKSSLLAK